MPEASIMMRQILVSSIVFSGVVTNDQNKQLILRKKIAEITGKTGFEFIIFTF